MTRKSTKKLPAEPAHRHLLESLYLHCAAMEKFATWAEMARQRLAREAGGLFA